MRTKLTHPQRSRLVKEPTEDHELNLLAAFLGQTFINADLGDPEAQAFLYQIFPVETLDYLRRCGCIQAWE